MKIAIRNIILYSTVILICITLSSCLSSTGNTSPVDTPVSTPSLILPKPTLTPRRQLLREITFADAHCPTCIQESGILYVDELKVLDCSRQDIESLEGFDQLTALVTLKLMDNRITDLTPLLTLPNLKHLDIGGNKLEDIHLLASLPRLFTLDLSYNKIKDLSPLADLPALVRLELKNNRISRLPALLALVALEDLDLADNQLTSCEALNGLSHLLHLDLLNNPLEDLSPLHNLKTLEELKFSFHSEWGREVVDALLQALPNCVLRYE